MKTQNISINRRNSAADAVRLYKLLQAVAGLIGSKGKFQVDMEEDVSGGSIGINFVPNDNVRRWHRVVQPDAQLVGWFGYCETAETRWPALDVWFYCGARSPTASAKIRSILRKRFPQAVIPQQASRLPGEKNYVRITLPASESTDNQQWFVSVFDSLVERN